MSIRGLAATGVSPAWLALREPADAAARSGELVDLLREMLPTGRPVTVHDLGSGTGSMTRWLAGRLTGPQRWVLHDRDPELLGLAARTAGRSRDGSVVTVETRRTDITRLGPAALAGADLITASAVLDMLTAEEVERLVAACAGAGCPVLIALSVTGRVDLEPPDPLDRVVAEAFNAHQRRADRGRTRLGPEAVDAAIAAFARSEADVVVRESPWRLGPGQAALTEAWFTGWLAAARAQRPGLADATRAYARQRLADAGAGRLTVTVGHRDLLVRPSTCQAGPRSAHPPAG